VHLLFSTSNNIGIKLLNSPGGNTLQWGARRGLLWLTVLLQSDTRLLRLATDE